MLRRGAAVAATVVVAAACASGSHRASVAAPASTASTGSISTVASTMPAPAPTVTASPPGSPPPPIFTPPVPASTTTTGPRPPATITAAQGGTTVHVARGQAVDVSLATGELWAEPASGDDVVLRRLSGGVNAQTGDATATFSAVASGTTMVTSDHRCLPKPGRVCAQYVARWSVTVVVQ